MNVQEIDAKIAEIEAHNPRSDDDRLSLGRLYHLRERMHVNAPALPKNVYDLAFVEKWRSANPGVKYDQAPKHIRDYYQAVQELALVHPGEAWITYH